MEKKFTKETNHKQTHSSDYFCIKTEEFVWIIDITYFQLYRPKYGDAIGQKTNWSIQVDILNLKNSLQNQRSTYSKELKSKPLLRSGQLVEQFS